MKILVTGGAGLLGRDCCEVLAGRHEIIAPSWEELDISEPDQVEAWVARFHPEAILNCAAFTQVDLCESEREQAVQANVIGPRNLAVSAARHGARLVHFSTDYVFDGQKPPPEPYQEDDATGPLSWYGRTKLESEMVVRSTAPRHLICRTSWLYGRHGSSFLKKILTLALSPAIPELKVVDDQFGSPTWSRRVAEQVARLLEAGGQGLYHASAEGYCTWYELAQVFLKLLGAPKTIRPCPTWAYPTPAVRPGNAILENRRLKEEGLNLMRPWQEDLAEFVAAWGEELIREAAG